METVLYSVCALAGWTACAYATWQSRRRWTDLRIARAIAFGAFAVGMTFSVPAVGRSVDTAAGMPELWRLAAHLCVMVIAASAEMQILILAYAHEAGWPRVARRIWASSIAAALLIVLYVVATRTARPVALNVEYARVPAVSAYLTVYLTAFGWYSLDSARLCRRFARLTPRPWSRRGFLVAAVGAWFSLAYCANKILFVLAYWIGFAPTGEHAITAVLITASGLLCMVGFTMPAWGPAVDQARRWYRRRRDYRLLFPLWRDLTEANPGLILDPALRRGRAPLRGLDYAVTRRVVEICDARLALRPFVGQRLSEAAQSIATTADRNVDDVDAFVEAVKVAGGTDAQRRGRTADVPDNDDLPDPPGGFDGLVEWLCRVARVYASPLVGQALAAADHASTAR